MTFQWFQVPWDWCSPRVLWFPLFYHGDEECRDKMDVNEDLLENPYSLEEYCGRNKGEWCPNNSYYDDRTAFRAGFVTSNPVITIPHNFFPLFVCIFTTHAALLRFVLANPLSVACFEHPAKVQSF